MRIVPAIWFVTVGASILAFTASCAGQKPSRQDEQRQDGRVNAAARAELQQCIQLYPWEQRARENAVRAATCVVKATELNNNSDDILTAYAHKYLQLSEEFAAGRSTKTEYLAKLQDYAVKLKTIRMQRENEERVARAVERIDASNKKQARCLEARQAAADRQAANSRNLPTTGFAESTNAIGILGDILAVQNNCE